MNKKIKIAVLPGDGIGPEVIAEVVKVLDALDLGFEYLYSDVGSTAFSKTGNSFPIEAKEVCEEANAVLLGAVGQNYGPFGIPKRVTHYLRFERKAYVGVRSLKLFPGIYDKDDKRSNWEIDIIIVKDNIEGFALDHKGELWDGDGIDERRITKEGVQHIIDYCYSIATKKDRKRVTCIDAHNLLYGDKVFRGVFQNTSKKYPEFKSESISVSIASTLLASNPGRFDIIVTPNIFGEIITGIIIGQIGGVGLAPSANIGEHFAYFEPVHGTAWDIAGKSLANPIGAILSGKMMLDWLEITEKAQLIEEAVIAVLAGRDVRTLDLGGNSSTEEIGNAIVDYIRSKEE
ncbi:MAG: isocitrate/isopropylmalate family dehydrogenase [Promethearchaeota archaeon]